MKPQYMMNPFTSNKWRFAGAVCSVFASSVLLSACGGGGGGGSTPVEAEAVVDRVDAAAVLEGNAGVLQPIQLKFLVTLSKKSVRGVDVLYTTASTAKEGFDNSTGSAKGVALSCPVVPNADADYVNVSAGKLSIAAGSSTGELIVVVCSDAIFEPNETLKVVWSSTGSAGGTAIGTIINDDVGGLNGTGATALLGNRAALVGRDVSLLTNNGLDGPLGFSFDKQPACTVDNVTGLTWQKTPVSGKNYASLSAYIASINEAGNRPCTYSDWRLPSANELLSLMNANSKVTDSPKNPNADAMGVSGDTMVGKYWTSETRANAPTVDAWYVDSDNAGVVGYFAQTNELGVRLVRGGSISLACDSNDRGFSDFLDGTVADSKTGLMWKKCPEGFSNTACSSGAATPLTSANAVIAQLDAANMASSNSGLGYSDWRIPTRNELASLVSRSCSPSPTIVLSIFPNTEALTFVTNTLWADDPGRVWSIDFAQGYVGVTVPFSAGMRLRLVRAGQ